MFLPDRVTPQYLPNGKLPCKWHGYNHDCVRRDSFFNPQGPCACIDDDQGITYIYSVAVQLARFGKIKILKKVKMTATILLIIAKKS